MRHVLVAVLIVGLAGMSANAQQTGGSHSASEFPDKPELLRRIALYESAVQNAHVDNAKLAKIYLELGGLYGDVAMYPKAEDAMQHAVALLRSGPQDQLADALGHLAVVHIVMGELRDAEKEQLEALRVRESVGDPAGIAKSWSDVADVYIKERNYKKALDYAQKAMDALGNDAEVSVTDRIAVRQTLAYAFSGNKDFARAIPLLKDAIELSKTSFGENSLEVGVGYYLLGYTAWQGGDTIDAAEWMGRGINRMKVDMGWGHPLYVNAMSQYALFLRKQGQMEAADSAQREVRRAQSVVDVRSFTGR
jgi:tetratricopeptide (TPR) repeat protein